MRSQISRGVGVGLLVLVIFVSDIPAFVAHEFFATCYGYDPCNACKNCKYCGHCAKNGGTCGVCRR
jgi:hypothetical protein